MLIGGILGIALAVSPALAAKPSAPVPDKTKDWLGNMAPPAGVLRRGERVRTVAVIDVSSDGTPTHCAVTQSPGPVAMGEYACKLYMERSRFRPARDEMGQAIAGVYRAVAIWEAHETAIDADSSKARGPRPGSDSWRWVTTDDLPPGLLKPDEIVSSNLVLTISTAGRVAGCAAPEPSTHPELDQWACRLFMARARYGAARDAAGEPMEATDWQTVRWQVPR